MVAAVLIVDLDETLLEELDECLAIIRYHGAWKGRVLNGFKIHRKLARRGTGKESWRKRIVFRTICASAEVVATWISRLGTIVLGILNRLSDHTQHECTHDHKEWD